MASLDSLPGGWTVWAEEDGGRVVLVYRPDVFDARAFDAACMPTITVAPGASPDRPPGRTAGAGAWHVALYLEPAVRVRALDATHGSRADAVAGAIDAAERFAAGEVDYRAAYQVPREAYLDALDALVGRDG